MRIESYLLWRRSRLTFVVRAVAWLAVWSVAYPATRAEAKPAGSIRLSCWEFNRGNARVCANPAQYGDYRDTYPGLMLTGGSELPWVVEYDVDFPVAATWTLRVRYASAGTRPLEVWIDDKHVGTCCGKETNNAPPYMDRHPNVYKGLPERTWGMHGAQWEESCKFPVTEGKHTLKFTRNGPPANIVEIGLESPVKFPKGWEPPKGDLDLTDVPTAKFSRSYGTLKKRKLVSYLESGFGSANVPPEPPLTFGSHRSKLIERIRKAPCKGDLTREDFIRIVTWIDANAPYYGTHRGKKNLKWKSEPDFRPLPLASERTAAR